MTLIKRNGSIRKSVKDCSIANYNLLTVSIKIVDSPFDPWLDTKRYYC
jgi:hypothetical protein